MVHWLLSLAAEAGIAQHHYGPSLGLVELSPLCLRFQEVIYASTAAVGRFKCLNLLRGSVNKYR